MRGRFQDAYPFHFIWHAPSLLHFRVPAAVNIRRFELSFAPIVARRWLRSTAKHAHAPRATRRRQPRQTRWPAACHSDAPASSGWPGARRGASRPAARCTPPRYRFCLAEGSGHQQRRQPAQCFLVYRELSARSKRGDFALNSRFTEPLQRRLMRRRRLARPRFRASRIARLYLCRRLMRWRTPMPPRDDAMLMMRRASAPRELARFEISIRRDDAATDRDARRRLSLIFRRKSGLIEAILDCTWDADFDASA